MNGFRLRAAYLNTYYYVRGSKPSFIQQPSIVFIDTTKPLTVTVLFSSSSVCGLIVAQSGVVKGPYNFLATSCTVEAQQAISMLRLLYLFGTTDGAVITSLGFAYYPII